MYKFIQVIPTYFYSIIEIQTNVKILKPPSKPNPGYPLINRIGTYIYIFIYIFKIKINIYSTLHMNLSIFSYIF
jgi:hypothetical protein